MSDPTDGLEEEGDGWDGAVNAALEVIARNLPRGDEQDDNAFLPRLREEGEWDVEAYAQLEDALVTLIKSGDSEYSAGDAFTIYSHFSLLIIAHFNPDDLAKLSGVDASILIDRWHRFDHVMRCYFYREVPDLTGFEPAGQEQEGKR